MPKKADPGAVLDLPILLDLERARRELGGVSERHIYNLVARGVLDRVKLGRSVRITAESIKRLVLNAGVAHAREKETRRP